MRQPIETAPKDGRDIRLEDDQAAYDVAHWSSKSSQWVRTGGSAIGIVPTYWSPIAISQSHYPEDQTSNNFQGSHVRRTLSASFITVVLTVGAPICVYFWSEISTVAARLLGLQDTSDTRTSDGRNTSATRYIGPPVANLRESPGTSQSSRREAAAAASQNSQAAPDASPSNTMQLRDALQKETLLNNALVGELAALRSELVAKSAIADKAAAEVDQTRRAKDAVAEPQNPAQQEAEKSTALTTELARMRSALEIQTAQSQKAVELASQERLAAERTIADLRQTLAQEQKKSAALIEEGKAASARTAAAEPQRRALEEAQGRAAALMSELARMRGEIEIQAAQSQKAVESASQEKLAAERTIADLRQTLAQEQEKSAALIEEGKASLARTAAAEPQRRALEEAQGRTAALMSELARMRGEIEIQTAQSQKGVESASQEKLAAERTIADLRQTLAGEQQKSAALIEEGKVALAKSAAAEPQRRALEEAQGRAATLTSELARVRGEIEVQRTQSQKAIDLATKERLAAERTAADLRQALTLEQQKSAALIEEGKVALAKSAAAEPQRRAIEEAQGRAATLTSELARVRGEIEVQRTQSQKAIDLATKERLAAERTAADLRQALALEQQKSAALIENGKVASAKKAAVDARATATPSWNGQVARVTPATKTSATEMNRRTDGQVDEVGKLIARAATLITQGNIGAARVVLERAAESGNARASFMLAETYDPIILSAWGTHGTRGEASKAREHYAKAHAGGIQEAKGRLDALGQ